MGRRPGTRHAVEGMIDRIEDITPTERIVLRALAGYGDWKTGENCRPKMRTLQAVTGLSRRTLQYALRSLCCPSAAKCERSATGGHTCHHRGYVALTTASGRYQPAAYAVLVDRMVPVQPHLPERAAWSGASDPVASDPFAHIIRRTWGEDDERLAQRRRRAV